MVATTTAYRTQMGLMGCYQSGHRYRKKPRNSADSGHFRHFGTDSHCIKDCVLIDPACGTAGFLVAAAESIRANYESTMTEEQWKKYESTAFTGFDTDRTMLRISAMNLMQHSISNPEIDYKDSVSKQNEISGKYSIILANEAVICGLTPEKACNFKEFAA